MTLKQKKLTNEHKHITNLSYSKGEAIVIDDSCVAITHDVAIVQLMCQVGKVHIESSGSARRFLGDETHKSDKSNKDVGAGLAFARALRSLATKVEKQALGLSKHDEDMRAHRAKIDETEEPTPTENDDIIIFQDSDGKDVFKWAIPKKDFKALKKGAKRNGRTIEAHINNMIEEELSREKM